MCCRDITILIVVTIIVYYSSLFQSFLSICYGPYILIFCILVCFDWWVVNPSIPHQKNYCLKVEVSTMLRCQLHSTSENYCNQSSHYEKYGQFLLHKRKSTHDFKDEWNTQEDTDKSMKNALYILQYVKRHLLGWSDVKQRKKSSL